MNEETRQAREEAERQRLNQLFVCWVPRAGEFFKIYRQLDLSERDVAAIKEAIAEYHVELAEATAQGRTYRPPWQPMSPEPAAQQAVEAQSGTAQESKPTEGEKDQDAKQPVDNSDPFGLGLGESSLPEKDKGGGDTSKVGDETNLGLLD